MPLSRPRIWCSPRSAAAARCWSSRCAPPASPANRRSSSSTCRPPVMSPQPREWFADVERRIDPATARSRSTRASPTSRRRRSGATTSAPSGRTPNGVWGGKLMWNQTPLLLQRAEGLPDRSGHGPAVGDPRRRRLRSGAGPRLPARRGLPGGVVLARGADPGVARPARSGARRPRRVPRRRHRARRHDAARPGGGLAHLVRRGGRRTDRRALPGAVAQPHRGRRRPCSRRSASIRGWRRRRCWNARPTSAPTNGSSATEPTPNGRDCRYDDSTRRTTPTSTNSGCWRPSPCTSSARWSPSCSARCCCSRRARTRSCCFGWRRRLFGPSRCRSRCCTSTPATTSTRSSSSATAALSEHGHKLIVGSVQETIDSGRVPDPGPGASRNRQQTRTLLDALEAGGFDAAFGGARRDEERARAKERILSFRDEFGQWDPRAQRPEPWSLYNGRIKKGEQVRVFPLSQLDRAGHLALHRAGGPRAAVDLLRPRARGRRARRHPAGGLGVRPARPATRRRPSSGCATAPSAT